MNQNDDAQHQGLVVKDLFVAFGGIRALSDVNITFAKAGIHALIGPNGAGKTTLLNTLSRFVEPTSGDVTYDGESILKREPHHLAELGIARTFQNLALIPDISVLENVLSGGDRRASNGLFSGFNFSPSARAQRAQTREQAYDLIQRLDLQAVADEDTGGLPYGTQKRVEVARALLMKPRVLLLDEPAGGLSHGEVNELADLIAEVSRQQNLLVVVIEHHMGFVMKISNRVTCLNFGQKIAEGTPQEIQQNEAVIEAYLGREQ